MATKVYTGMGVRLPLGEVPEYVRRVEAVGYDGIVIPEAVHDGFLVCLSALEHSQSLTVTAGVVLAFPRSPMVVAHAAWDLQSFSGGRFELGLGSQVKGNVVGRFSVPWTNPVRRMREYLQSLRAIWDCWQKGSPLDFQGEHYSFTRMQPYFNPGPIGHPHIPLFLGAVNPAMTRLAGEVCDGMISHPTSSDPRYIREVTVPSLEVGARRVGRSMQEVDLAVGGFVIAGQNRSEVAKAREDVRELMAFLYSTPAYWPTLELHGWGDVGHRLRQMTRQGGWRGMAREVTDEIVDQLAVTGTYDEIADKLKERHRGLANRISFPMPADPSLDRQVAGVVSALKS